MYPKVRFRGFDESWRTEKLKNIGESFSGLSGKKSSDFGHGEAKYITYLNILNNPIIDTKLTDKIEIDNKQHLVKKGDIFFTISSETPQEVGLSSVLDTNLNECYLNSFSFGYRLKEISMFDNLFNSYNFRSPNFRRKMYILAQGISRYNISKKAVLNETICFPKISEQKQIGKLIKLMNSLLSLQQRKLELENKLKKQIAFYLYSFTLTPNFKHIEVKNKKLGDIVDISNGIMGDSQKKSGNFKLTRIETISNGKIDLSRTGYIDQVSDEKKFLEVGDILYSNINSLTHIGKNAIVKEKHLPLVHGINLFRLHITNNQITPNYLHGLLNLPKYKWWVKSHANPAVNQASINKTELSSLVIKYPDLDIQNQINNINYSFAQYWDIQYSKKESLCQLKQFLLQNLFI
ncbi:restriction endonuclease subunit S [Lactobacillus jensenii]|uniref:restriction endonuclease subunit S n=1 Tax=Lactobacillus jensenii TaxID=109790 RepID=UPI0001A5DD43|nr:restriction endonuclease subunit S [Lactobacillus jensenii]MDK6812069.1 restriction endonuclease subunit S [Lactobacillus jensenii]MDK8616569.1 restriction endonuclease subunit S [Lactobacillus jensenii]MDT9619889.1 restriction endonuclease subunit S [Lactobacillus jensenii]NGG32616.1 restriction endonuclease subunit S [Lactobacillus jensenii]NJJ52592.1 restriction endonuclease subunit S [Lactobacillus jensenii]